MTTLPEKKLMFVFAGSAKRVLTIGAPPPLSAFITFTYNHYKTQALFRLAVSAKSVVPRFAYVVDYAEFSYFRV